MSEKHGPDSCSDSCSEAEESPGVQEHEDMFSEDEPDQIKSAARHMRQCQKCRPALMDMAKQTGRFMLEEFEHEMGRRATTDEKRTIAKMVLIQVSTGAAIAQRGAASIVHAAKNALEDPSELMFSASGSAWPVVGEA